MIKKLFRICFVAVISLCLISCSGKKNEEKQEIILKPETTEVTGDLEDCFVVIDREYKATEGFGNGIITVEIERTDEDLPFDLEGKHLFSFSQFAAVAYIQVGFGIEFLDADGNILDKVDANGSGFSGSYSPDEAVALVKLKPGKKGTIRFSIKDAAKEAVSFRITSAYESNSGGEGGEYVSDDTDNLDDLVSSSDDELDEVSISNHSSKATANKDWDKILDSYEKYVDKCISLSKRIDKGDMSAYDEYPGLMKKAQEIGDEMQGAYDYMSSTQWARYAKITNKLSQVLEQSNKD